MKRFVIVFLILISVPLSVCASEHQEYNEYLNSFDLGFVDELSNDVKEYLDDLDVMSFDYNSISNISFSNISSVILDIAKSKLKNPFKSCVYVLIFVLFSAFLNSFSTKYDGSISSVYSTISAIAIAITLLLEIGKSIKLATSTLSIAANFIYAFIPTFSAIIAVGGGVATSFSTNTTLLLLAQTLTYISANIFTPVVNSFLALGVCSSLRTELNISSFLGSIKKMIISSISFVSAMFVSILSIKTSVSARSDILGIRSVRFVINTVVPVIGGSISEGLLSIQSYSSLIKSSVGIVGIICLALVFLPSIIEIVIWRIILSFCSMISSLFCDNSVSSLVNAFKETLLIINVLLVLSLVTTIISVGILIASRTM